MEGVRRAWRDVVGTELTAVVDEGRRLDKVDPS